MSERSLTITDQKPLLGWTKQKRLNQALLRAVLEHDLTKIAGLLELGANINAKGGLNFQSSHSKWSAKISPFRMAIEQRFTEGACFLLDKGAKFGSLEIRDFLNNAFQASPSKVNTEFLEEVGLALIENGWNPEPDGPGGVEDFSVYERAELELISERFPTIVQLWKERWVVVQDKQKLEAQVPHSEISQLPKAKTRL